jgi:thiol-disulfide isomerase/thioredoxin
MSGSPSLQQRSLALLGIVAIVGVALVVLLLAGVLGSQGGGEGIENVTLLDTAPVAGRGDLDVGPQVGRLAPDFELSGFDGTRHRLSDFRGKPVYLNFWATWCVPCQVELPDMFVLQEEHSDELVVVSVNRGESVDRARAFFQNLTRLDGELGIGFPVDGMDPDETLFDAYRGLGMPVSVFIDADGVVTGVHNGLIRLEQMETELAKALESAPLAAARS